jgi:hypothetical protein
MNFARSFEPFNFGIKSRTQRGSRRADPYVFLHASQVYTRMSTYHRSDLTRISKGSFA